VHTDATSCTEFGPPKKASQAQPGILITISDEVEREAQFEFTLAAITQNLRRLARLAARPPPVVAACVT